MTEPLEDRLLEHRLTQALESQASSITVVPGEHQIHEQMSPVDEVAFAPRRGISKRVFVLVGTASFALAAIAFGMISLRSGEQTATTEAASGSDLLYNSLLVDPETGEPIDFVIWIDPDTRAESITRISDLLADDDRFSEYRYFSQEEVFREFREYYADQPTVLELVNPEEVPTYFQVTLGSTPEANNPEAPQIEADYAALEGVFKIQFPDEGPDD